MSPAPIKPEYGPTLPELVVPRWRRANRRQRRLVVVAGAVTLVAVAALVGFVVLRRHAVVHDGAVPFDFTYYGPLHRVAADPGGYVKLDVAKHGRVVDSFAVDALLLPPYRGDVQAALTMYATPLIRTLAASIPGFDLYSEGKTRINNLPGYGIAFKTSRRGRTVYGRYLLLVPPRAHVRAGVVLALISHPGGTVTAPDLVGAAGPLQQPLRSFALD